MNSCAIGLDAVLVSLMLTSAWLGLNFVAMAMEGHFRNKWIRPLASALIAVACHFLIPLSKNVCLINLP
jgi:hypothetical protein